MRQIPIHELPSCVGQALGSSDWLTLDQDRINRFAEVTLDHQWIHVDAQRAAIGPFGTTIAHGFLTLSLLPYFLESTFEVTGSRMGVNYGLNRVRFPAPVPVNSRLRAHFTLVACEPLEGDGFQLVTQAHIECEGSDKPVCVAELVSRRYV